MMINLALKHLHRFFFSHSKMESYDRRSILRTSQKYFTSYTDLPELKTRKIFPYQLQWCKSQQSV